jgi:hypothetical protein
MKRYSVLLLLIATLVAGCIAPKTVVVTREVVREVKVTRVVTQVVVKHVASQEGLPTSTPYPTFTPYPTYTPFPTSTWTPSPTPRPTEAQKQQTTSAPTATTGPAAPVSLSERQVAARGSALPVQAAVPTPDLERLPDRDPGPPFAISVSALRADPDSTYKVTGFVRNDGTETYEAIGVNATFFDDEGFRQGPIDARCPCVLLAPGESCPFSIELAVRRPVSFLLHPEGRPTKRESVPVEIRGVQSVADGLNSLRIDGTVVNKQPFKIKNPVVIGALKEGSGEIVTLGWAYILQEDILPGQGVPFSLRVEEAPYAHYQLYAQAERDWQ